MYARLILNMMIFNLMGLYVGIDFSLKFFFFKKKLSYNYVGDECSCCVSVIMDVCHGSNHGMRCLQYIPLARL